MSVNGFDFDGTVHRYNYNSLDNIPPNIAPAYSASATYAVGDYCTKDNVLYKCSTAISTAEAWNSAHWTQVQLATDVADLKDDLNYIIGGDSEQVAIEFVHGYGILIGDDVAIGDTVDLTNMEQWYSLKYAIVNCQEGDVFVLDDMRGAINERAWTFLTSDNVLISRSATNQTVSGNITAPQNAGKIVIQGIYRQYPDDTTTDWGTAYKIVQGTGNVVRFDIVQDKTEEEKARARANIGVSSGGGGLSDEAKAVLLDCFANVAWIDEHGQDYYDALEEALYGIVPSDKISVVFNSNGRTFYTDDPISSITANLTVTYDGVVTTNYGLTGTLSDNNVRVKIGDEYSRVIPITAEEPKHSYLTTDGLSILDASVDYSANPVPGIILNTGTGYVAATEKGRKPFTNGNGWYPIPVPADCSSATISVQPSNLKYGVILYRFAPDVGTSYYVSQFTDLTGTNTITLDNGDLREIVLVPNHTTPVTSCAVTFS